MRARCPGTHDFLQFLYRATTAAIAAAGLAGVALSIAGRAQAPGAVANGRLGAALGVAGVGLAAGVAAWAFHLG